MDLASSGFCPLSSISATLLRVSVPSVIRSIPAIREGGDRGLPVALAGPKSPQAAAFYAMAEKLMEQAEQAAASASDVIEIS